MARWKKPSREEVLENRRTLAQRARSGDLRLPQAIAEIRKGFGMTQHEFASALSLTRRQVSELESESSNPTLQTMEKIAKVFGFTIGFVPKK